MVSLRRKAINCLSTNSFGEVKLWRRYNLLRRLLNVKRTLIHQVFLTKVPLLGNSLTILLLEIVLEVKLMFFLVNFQDHTIRSRHCSDKFFKDF